MLKGYLTFDFGDLMFGTESPRLLAQAVSRDRNPPESLADFPPNNVLSNITGGATLGAPNQAVLTITEKIPLYLPLTLQHH